MIGKIIVLTDRLGSIIGCGSVYLTQLALFAIFIAGVALIYIFLKRAGRDTAAKILLFLLGFLFLRFVVLYNPLAWKFYQSSLTWKDVGWREKDVINYRVEAFRKSFIPERPDCLAVGSSQVGSIFYYWEGKTENVKILSLAGLRPVDFYLYRQDITARQPRHVLLYLSEFDIASKAQESLYGLCPPQGIGVIPVLNALRKAPQFNNRYDMMAAMIVREILPEYLYAFVLRGFLKKIFLPGIAMAAQPSMTAEEIDVINKLSSGWSSEHIDSNIYFLEQFLIYCEKHNLPVTIVEGHYNPMAQNEKTIKLNKLIMQRLNEVAA